MTVRGNTTGSSLANVKDDSLFLLLEQSCTITGAEHSFDTKRRTRSCGSDCSETYYVCEDQVRYTFVYDNPNDRCINNTEYSSRVSITERNEERVTFDLGFTDPDIDRCTVNQDTIEYQGYVAGTSSSPFVCYGICENGTRVDCWKPITTRTGDYENWADCGNDECLKLVNPKYELEAAQEGAEVQAMLGYFLIGLGVAVSIFTIIAWFCCCSGAKENNATTKNDNNDSNEDYCPGEKEEL